mmetsp:Transcript_15569/g.45620  ORF Transcript_15569/g.45620 Transcript_15569/m.45620 type:complete len:320 (+) Transcript_15569:485-1444(+)
MRLTSNSAANMPTRGPPSSLPLSVAVAPVGRRQVRLAHASLGAGGLQRDAPQQRLPLRPDRRVGLGGRAGAGAALRLPAESERGGRLQVWREAELARHLPRVLLRRQAAAAWRPQQPVAQLEPAPVRLPAHLDRGGIRGGSLCGGARRLFCGGELGGEFGGDGGRERRRQRQLLRRARRKVGGRERGVAGIPEQLVLKHSLRVGRREGGAVDAQPHRHQPLSAEQRRRRQPLLEREAERIVCGRAARLCSLDGRLSRRVRLCSAHVALLRRDHGGRRLRWITHWRRRRAVRWKPRYQAGARDAVRVGGEGGRNTQRERG